MSHTVVRGKPTAAQLYVDGILKEILAAKGIKDSLNARDQLTLAEIMFHCLKKKPNDINMINGATGEKFTNEQILKRAVSLARSMMANNLTGKTVFVLMKNQERAAAMYWAVIFAGLLPFLMDPNTTAYEISLFLKLIEPHYVFCDQDKFSDVNKAMGMAPGFKCNVLISDEDQHLNEFTAGLSDDIDSFQVAASSPDSSVLLLPTSGSTGLPKAALMTNRGLVAQIATPWLYYSQFPKPTDLAMLLTTLQWMTYTITATCSAMFEVPLLVTPKKSSVEHVLEMTEKFRPTWTFFGPAFGKSLITAARSDQLSSLKTVTLLGAPSTPEFIAALQEKLSNTVWLCDGYGTTETQGFIALPDRDAPPKSNGRVSNIMLYKMLDDNGVEVGPGNNGELWVKGECVIKGYFKDDESYSESFEDGWYKTGDWFHSDVNERLFYIERRKFSFKYLGNQVSPQEIEGVISTVPGVQECIVCASDNGPAAAIVCDPTFVVSREQIHRAVDSTLSDHKRLRGGIAFVDSLPHTHSGKLQRADCKKLVHKLIETGECVV